MTDPYAPCDATTLRDAMPRDNGTASAISRWAEAHTTLFASPAWFAHWMDAFGRGECGSWSRPGCALTVPYIVRTRKVAGIGVRVAIGAANSYTPQYDVVGDELPSVAELRAMLADLRCAMLELPFLGPQSLVLRSIIDGTLGAGAELVRTEAAPLIDCRGDWDRYLASRSKSRRKEWREKEDALARSGAELRVFEQWEDIEPRFAELLDVEASGWKGRNGTAIRQRPNARRFFDRLCPDLAMAGKLRILAIVRADRVLAFKLCTLHGGRLSSLKTGYLDDLARESPGQVLQLWTARWCFEQPDVQIFDFLAPATPHKLAWATEVEQLHTLRVYRKTAPGAMAWLRWTLGPRLKGSWRQTTGRSSDAGSSGEQKQDAAAAIPSIQKGVARRRRPDSSHILESMTRSEMRFDGLLRSGCMGALALLVAASAAAPASAQGQPRRASVDYNRANDYYAAVPTGRHKVVEQYHLGPCERYLNDRNYRKALGECQFILRIFPNHPQALMLTVRACEYSPQTKCDLTEVFGKAVAINPEAADTFVIRGIYLHNVEKYADARKSYERALALDANSINAHYNLGLACLELKDFGCANSHAQQAYALGAQLPGLRKRLQRAGQWGGMPAASPSSRASAEGKAPSGRP